MQGSGKHNKKGQVGIWLPVSVPLQLRNKVSDCLNELLIRR